MNGQNIYTKFAAYSTAGAMSIVLLGGFAVAPVQAAVAFNTFPISYSPSTNHDWPMIDARNVSDGGSFSSSQSDHDNGVTADAGEEIEFQIYYHNSGVTEDEATNVVVRAFLPGGTRDIHEVSATIDSDQTSAISSADAFRGGNIDIHINGDAQTLQFISGSVLWFPNRSTSSQFLSNANSLVGSGVNIGTIKGCFDFSGFLTFRARGGSTGTSSQDRDLSISKRVTNVTRADGSLRDSTNANPGDRVHFEIRFDVQGNASQNDVIARDIMPSRLIFVSGSLRVDGGFFSNENEFFGGGRNFGTLNAGRNIVITYDATVASAGAFSGTTFLTNTANVRSDQVGTRQDEADVVVQPAAATTSFSLRKTAFNSTKGVDATTVAADPGDSITYTLFYRNAGSVQINNVIIEDEIHDVLELAFITDQGGATSVNSVIRYSPVSVPAGVEVSRSFQVRVREANLFPANSELVMVNVYGNEVRIPVRKPRVIGVVTPPRTGPSEIVMVALASLTTAGYWLYERRKRFATI